MQRAARYTASMEGNPPGNGRRLLVVAVLFALAAIVIFILVWQWPAFFNMRGEEEKTSEITEEEKRRILQDLSQSGAADMPSTEKRAALEAVDASSQESGAEVSTGEKMDTLRALDE